jgi:hypothetical protein
MGLTRYWSTPKPVKNVHVLLTYYLAFGATRQVGRRLRNASCPPGLWP